MRRHIRENQTDFALDMSARLKTVLPIRRQPPRVRQHRTPFHRRQFLNDCFNCSAHMFLSFAGRKMRRSPGT
jgi:hypothetical protein